MGDIRATNVEKPADRGRVGQHDGVRALVLHGIGDPAGLVARRFAGEFQRMNDDRFQRRRRQVIADAVDRIAGNGNQFGILSATGIGKPFCLGDGVQPGIEADAHAGFNVIGQPFMRRRCDHVLRGEDFRIGLRPNLERVAPVSEDMGGILQDDRSAGGTGKAGQPCKPLGAFGQVLVLVFVGMRHQKGVEPLLFHAGAQGGNAGLAG
jgi:hypothetical protein